MMSATNAYYIDNYPWMDVDKEPSTPPCIIEDIPVTMVSLTEPEVITPDDHMQACNYDSKIVTQEQEGMEVDHNNNTTSTQKLQSVDDSKHAPKDAWNRKTLTYDARVPASDIPGDSPAEKISFLQGWFRGITSLKRIFIDEIYKTDYYILQFSSINTMRAMIRKFNRDNPSNARLTAQTYVKSTKLATTVPGKNKFKILDLNGDQVLADAAIEMLAALVDVNGIQVLNKLSPEVNEVQFSVLKNKDAKRFNDIWAVAVGRKVIRIGPATFTDQDFLNRNRWTGKSSTIAHHSDSHILNSLEALGVKDVYRPSYNSKDMVMVVFESETALNKAVSGNITMGDIRLGMEYSIHSQKLSSNKLNQCRSRPRKSSRSPSPVSSVTSMDQAVRGSRDTSPDAAFYVDRARKRLLSDNCQKTEDNRTVKEIHDSILEIVADTDVIIQQCYNQCS